MVTADGERAQPNAIAQLAFELREQERLLRETMASRGRLLAAAANAQASQGLSLLYGEKVYGMLSEGAVDISRVVTSTATAHRALEAVGRTLGIDVRAYGEGSPKPKEFFTGSDLGDAAPVRASAA